jgi:hypothetical protein
LFATFISQKDPNPNTSEITNYLMFMVLDYYWNRIQAAEMKYLRTVKGCTRLDKIRNEDIRNELCISPLSEKNNRIQE